MTPIETFEWAGCTVKIYHDDDTLDPRKDWDHPGTVMVTCHSRYVFGGKDDVHMSYCDDGLIAEHLAEVRAGSRVSGGGSHGGGVLLPLYLYDHGGLSMSCGSFGDPWDSGQVGFIYMTAEDIRKEFSCKKITAKVREQAIQRLKSEVEEYDLYLRGECYGYVVEAPDYSDFDPKEDSCWGFLGNIEYCIEEAKHAAEYMKAAEVA